MNGNSGWPEKFGFRIGGGRPVVIVHVDEDSSARSAGLQTGDQIMELNNQNVQQLTIDELKFLAQQSKKVPPSLAVISRVKTLEIRLRSSTPDYGFTLRGNGPVFVRKVDVKGPAWTAGLRSGDLVLQVNGEDMQYASKLQIEKVVREVEDCLQLVVIGSGLTSLDSTSRTRVNHSRTIRYKKARSFYQQMNYYLHGVDSKKSLLVLALKEFARDRSVNQLAHACVSVLTTPTQRKLLKEIRSFIPPKQHAAFDVLVKMDSDIMSSPARGMGHRQGSHPNLGRTGSAGLSRLSEDSSMYSSTPSMTDIDIVGNGPRSVKIERGSSGFGFTLSGMAVPVCLTQVDKGSVAYKAGLKPGDQILEINGLNVRNKSKADVVRLLKGSGTNPSLLVEQKQQRLQKTLQTVSLTSLPQSSSTSGYSRQVARKQSRQFQSKMASLLTAREKKVVASCLEKYKDNRNVDQLVQSLSLVLTTNEKVSLMHDVCQLLPAQEQTKFDQVAAKMIGEFQGQGPVQSGFVIAEQVEDVLYRVQGMELGVEDRVVSGHQHWKQTRKTGVGHLEGLEMISEDELIGVVTRRPCVGSYGKGPKRLSTLSGDSVCATAEVSEYGNAVPSPSSISFGSSFPLSSNNASFSVGTGISVSAVGTPGSGGVQLGTSSQSEVQTQPGLISQHLTHTGDIPVSTAGTQVDTGKHMMAKPDAATAVSLGELLAKAKPPTNDDDSIQTGSAPPPPPPPPSPPLGPDGIPPPPPLPGGIPPPPPIGGIQQKSRLKQVNWEKLSTSNLQDTVWSQLSTLPELDELLELDEQFASGTQWKESAAKKDESKAILDPKKSYNISILIGHLKLSFEEIRDAVLGMDDHPFSQQHLRQMEAYAPEMTEIEAYRRFTGDPQKLSKADRFSMMMSTVPCYRERLSAMAFKLNFFDKIEEIEPDFEDIIAASMELQNSVKFKKILELILAMGNYMNAGNMRVGGASGFRISYLTKLDSTKTSDNKSTLMHFLAKTIQNKYSDILSVGNELGHMAAAAKVSTQTLVTEVNELRQGLDAIHRESQSYSRLGVVDPEKDRFVQYTTEFVASAREKMQSLLDLQTRMNVEYEKAVRFFGEDSAKTRSDEFFAVFYQFLGTFERALQHNINQEEQKAEREKREKERQEIVNRKRSSQAGGTNQSNGLESAVSGQEELRLAVLHRQLDPSKLAELETNLKKHRTEGSGSEDFQAVLQQKRRAMKTVRFSSDTDKDMTQDDERQQVLKCHQMDPSKLADLEGHTTDFRGILGSRGKKAVSFADESDKIQRHSEEVTMCISPDEGDQDSHL